MLDRSLPANGERIRTLRKEQKLTQSDLAIKVGIDKHSIENAEAGRNIRETNLQRIAEALDVSLDDIVRPEQCETAPVAKRPREHSEASVSSDAGQNETARDGFRIFGFGERSLAIDLLVHWQKKLKSTRARVICFTGQTLDAVFVRLLDVGIKKLDIFMGTKAMARRLESHRQEELFDLWWVPHISDLYRHIESGTMTIQYFDCPASFTGIALGTDVYLLNSYIWMPTLNWLNDSDPDAYQDHWESMNVTRLPCIDDYTVNASDMPSLLVSKSDTGIAGDAFGAISQSFERVWKTLERDLGRPPEPRRKHYEPFEEMTMLQERLMAEERRKATESRAKFNRPPTR